MHRKPSLTFSQIVLAAFLLLAALPEGASAVETPTSISAGRVEVPLLRVPKTSTRPTMDGVMEDGEWADASAISNFWYDFSRSDFRYLAPMETQLQVYAMYDDENLYIAYRSPVYPEGSWLRARGRFPNVLHHPVYGILWDDHIELELRPYHDAAYGFVMGLFRWTINPLGVADEALWSPATGWEHAAARSRIASTVTPTHWVLEIAIPLEGFRRRAYAGADENGTPVVQIPQPDGSIWRCWFVRAISGTGAFFNANDAHIWNTTNMQLVFDSRAVGFQVNELGPIMEDMIDLRLTVKNHNNRSEAVRLGFFVESVDGTIYSSYEDEQLTDGLLELIPGETRNIRLRKYLPGITTTGNTLWFDVRSAGTPAKILYRTRLVNFHSQDATFPGPDRDGKPTTVTFKERRIDVIAKLRPPRKDFDVRYDFWPYDNNLAVTVDRGGHGASEKAKAATEARVAVINVATQEEIATQMIPFHGDFATGEFKLPELEDGVNYQLLLLLFDKNKRIVGEEKTGSFNKWALPDWMLSEDIPERVRAMGAHFTPPEKWFRNELGLSDTVWEPFTPIQEREDGFETLNHVFVLDATGLPAQIFIKPEDRVLPLEMRGEKLSHTDERLVKYGRGPQLRGPVRLQATIGSVGHTAEVVEPAKLVRKWNSEFEYQSRVKIGPIEAKLTVRYDCDGSFNVLIDYGADGPTIVDAFAMEMDLRGRVDTVANAMREGGMAGSDQWECSLPEYEGIVWDSATLSRLPLYYSFFVPWIYFGSGDRGFSYFSDTDREWGLDVDGSAMTIRRNADGEVTWRVIFINHPFDIEGSRRIDFTMLTHPAKPKPKGFRSMSWLFNTFSAIGYDSEPADLSEEYLKRDWRRAAQAPGSIPWEKADTWRKDDPPFTVYGRWRNAGGMHTWHPYHAISPGLDRMFEDRAVYLLGRQIRVGRRSGWWWDEYWPSGFSNTQNIAGGYAYIRDPEQVREDQIPWQAGWTTGHMRNTHKRLARIFKESNVPQRQSNWSNNQANMTESFGWASVLVEECGSDHRSLEVDVVAQYPISIYRYMTKHFLGLVTNIVPGAVGATPGDDTRLDRQYLGLGLLHDVGVSPSGPHGNLRNVNQAMRLIDILTDFGLFEDGEVEFIPYWRSQDIIRYGNGRTRYAPSIDLSKAVPDEQVYISVYRRPFEKDGRQGYKALIVIMNGFRRDVRSSLRILQPQRLFGGANNFTRADAFSRYEAEFDSASALLTEWSTDGNSTPVSSTDDNSTPVLIDPEHGNVVELLSDENGEFYGPVYVPRHNYRIFYAHFLAE